MTRIYHRLVGYGRITGDVMAEHDIPEACRDFAKQTAGVGYDDPEAVLCYRLTGKQTRAIAKAIGATVDADALNFYMEGFANLGR